MNDLERQVLKKARKLIEQGEFEYICHALDSIANSSETMTVYFATGHLKNYISQALKPWSSLVSWQQSRGIYRAHNLQRLDRIRWIDWMLGDITDEQLNQMMKDWS